MSKASNQPTLAAGGGGVGLAAAPHYLNNLLGLDGQPVNADLRRVLAQAGRGTLAVFRFTDERETFYALGFWANDFFARPPAQRHTGYATRLVARYYTGSDAELPALITALLPLAPAYAPARPLGAALCFADPWPVLNRLPAQARRWGPCVVQKLDSPHRPESAQVRGLRRKLAEAEARLKAVKKVKPTAPARVGVPTGSRPLWLTLPVGAELLGVVQQQLTAEIAGLRQQLADG
jgi:hypothetical protein